ncbi:hypothetical protein WJX74_000950 [Apatococcus lobatus]|uniref:Protein kinase domain-containing protein n=1 Tax=Apatococcus lobatus TaxID=904363 RepID=A0AAW1RMK2_9CHLO
MRKGTAYGESAVFKCFDLSQAAATEEDLLRERDLFSKMTSIQGKSVPRLLISGYTHDRLLGFLAYSAGTDTLDTKCTRREAEQAKAALSDVHACSILHGDVDLRNFVRAGAPDGQSEGCVLISRFVAPLPRHSLDLSNMSQTGCPALDGNSKGSSIEHAITPRDQADAIRTSGGIPSNTAAVRSHTTGAAEGYGDHKSEAAIQGNQQRTEHILDSSSAAHGGEENDMSDYKGAMHGTGPHATYR